MAKIDALIDQFVGKINSEPREPGAWFDIPPSVRVRSPDDFESDNDWQIRPSKDTDWIERLESSFPSRFPESYRSLVTRYIFPNFEAGSLSLLGNTPEALKFCGLRESLATPMGEEMLAEKKLVQFARPAGGDFDAICFDMSVKRQNREFPIVRVDHEDVLCIRKPWQVVEIYRSFDHFLREFLEA